MTGIEINLHDVVIALLGFGMLIKGWTEHKSTGKCSECVFTPEMLEGVEKMVDALVGPRAIDPVDNQYRWMVRDIGKDAVARQIQVAEDAREQRDKIAKENHGDHEKIVRMLGTLLARVNGGRRGQ